MVLLRATATPSISEIAQAAHGASIAPESLSPTARREIDASSAHSILPTSSRFDHWGGHLSSPPSAHAWLDQPHSSVVGRWPDGSDHCIVILLLRMIEPKVGGPYAYTKEVAGPSPVCDRMALLLAELFSLSVFPCRLRPILPRSRPGDRCHWPGVT